MVRIDKIKMYSLVFVPYSTRTNHHARYLKPRCLRRIIAYLHSLLPYANYTCVNLGLGLLPFRLLVLAQCKVESCSWSTI